MTLTSKFKKDLGTLRAAANKEIFLDVKQGDELLVVKFGGEEKKDPLLQSLEDRITELKDPVEEDDDEDDDGDIIVRT